MTAYETREEIAKDTLITDAILGHWARQPLDQQLVRECRDSDNQLLADYTSHMLSAWQKADKVGVKSEDDIWKSGEAFADYLRALSLGRLEPGDVEDRADMHTARDWCFKLGVIWSEVSRLSLYKGGQHVYHGLVWSSTSSRFEYARQTVIAAGKVLLEDPETAAVIECAIDDYTGDGGKRRRMGKDRVIARIREWHESREF